MATRADIETRLASRETREEALLQLAGSPLRRAASIAVGFVEDPDPFVRNAAWECLLKRGGRRYIGEALRGLGDSDEIARTTALECLVAWGARSAAREIAPLLGDPSPTVRAYAAWALGRLRANARVRALQRRLLRETDGVARAGLLEALTVLTRRQAYFDDLLALLRHGSHRVRCFAANSVVGAATRGQRRRAVDALGAALRVERTVAGRESLRANLRLLR